MNDKIRPKINIAFYWPKQLKIPDEHSSKKSFSVSKGAVLFNLGHNFHKRCARFLVLAFLALPVILSFALPGAAYSQGIFGYFSDSLVFTPKLTGKFKIEPVFMRVINGQDVYNMYADGVFINVLAEAGLARLSMRLVYEPRSFRGTKLLIDGQGKKEQHFRFEFDGLGLGVGAEIIRRRPLIAGITLDYDLYPPKFSGLFVKDQPVPAFNTTGPNEVDIITAQNPVTLGAYATYYAPMEVLGMIPTFDASFRTSVMGPYISDYKVSGGLRLPTTIMGTTAIRAGYQNTAVQFKKDQSITNREINIGYAGWFLELAYYY